MNFPFRFRRELSAFLVAAFVAALPLQAQSASPFTMDKRFSADELITTKNGMTMTAKIFMDNGKVRNEMNTHGMDLISIILPDRQKAYSILPEQKMVMVMPYDPTKYKSQMAAAAVMSTKFDLVGPETVEGVACNKYQGITPDKKAYFIWADAARKIPVKMMAEDGSFTLVWKNYQTGPQDPALFVPPSDYQTMDMPNIPKMPAGQ